MRPIDSLRGIFALMIVWHHYAPMMNVEYHYDFGNTIVLFFFILSGFGIALSWKERISGNEKEFIIKRCAKIFPIQWLTVCACVIFWGNTIESLWALPFHLTLTQSLIPLWQINFTLNTPSWFLSSIFICYLLTPFLLKTINKLGIGKFFVLQILLIIIIEVGIYLLPDSIGHRWLCYINPFYRFMDFSIGVSLGYYMSKGNVTLFFNVVPKFWLSILEVLLVCALFLFMMYPPLFQLDVYPIYRYPIIVILIILLTIGKGCVSYCLNNKVLLWLGNMSLTIYMTHVFCLSYFTQRLLHIPLWVKVIVVYSVVLLVACVLNKYFIPQSAKYFTKMVTKLWK